MNYICPYCGHHTTITDPNHDEHWNLLRIQQSTSGRVGFGVAAITCPNIECKKLKLKGYLSKANTNGYETDVIQTWNLLPESEAKVLPDYIPDAIRQDYLEACRIRDLSPKASATLSRRCLQGMIRNFHGISKSTLFDEIKDLEGKISQDVWESINAVREVGNVGAHMKKDINIIVDVEPEEAQLLIGLIEQLIEDWYVVREERRKRSENLKQIAIEKKNPTQKK